MYVPSYNYLKDRDKLIRTVQSLCSKVNKQDNTTCSIPKEWLTANSMGDLIDLINADTTAVPGKMYFSTFDNLNFTDWPTNSMTQGELRIEVMARERVLTGVKDVILFTLTSGSISPYHWEYTSLWGNTGSWKAFTTT